MESQFSVNQNNKQTTIDDNRSQLLAGIPADERRIDLAGLSSAVLEGGEGPPVVLLHGPGESSLWWMRVIPKLVKTHHVIVPDLPGHGASGAASDILDVDFVFRWLSELIDRTCSVPPVLVGHLLGGSIAARFAVDRGDRISRLVLVNSFGLGKFRPAPAFAFRLIRFLMHPTRKNYSRFLPHCMYDVDNLRKKMGTFWEPFLAYNLECAGDDDLKAALRTLMKETGVPKIPAEDLAQIDRPTALIWGRHDRANKLSIAEAASERYGWPLHIIEETRDDPKLERPGAFVKALYKSMDEEISKQKSTQTQLER